MRRVATATGEQRRVADTGEQRRVADTGEFRRFLAADEAASGRPGEGASSRTSETASRRGEWVSATDSTGPEAAERRHTTPPPARIVATPEPRRQSRAVNVGIALLGLVVLIAGGVVGVVYFTSSDDGLDSVLQLGAGESGKRTVTAPLDNRSAQRTLAASTMSISLPVPSPSRETCSCTSSLRMDGLGTKPASSGVEIR